MRFAVICLIGTSVTAFPCAYDTDPREPAAVATIVAKLFPANNGSATAGHDFRLSHSVPKISP
jgi:hypothetical protein